MECGFHDSHTNPYRHFANCRVLKLCEFTKQNFLIEGIVSKLSYSFYTNWYEFNRLHEKVLYDLIRIAAQEIRIAYELFDFYTNYDTYLIRF